MAKKKNKKSFGWRGQILLIMSLLTAVLFSAVAIVLAVGMVPTFVAAIVDRSEGRIRALTVGAINFAGCTPFIVEVFKKGNNIETAISYIIQPRTIVVMYFAAAMGYLIDWAMTGIVSSILVSKTKKRLKDIQKDQKDLIERWGPEVTGTMPLDEYGFPKDLSPQKTDEQPAS
jgi:hypothetical protein